MKMGQVYKVALNQLIAASRFAPGHRIRIEIAGSNFPHYERNLNTGGNNFDETAPKIANVWIHHDSQFPSSLVLPEVAPAPHD